MTFGITFILLSSLAYSQDPTPQLSSYVPVSPNAASLGKFGIYPVNYNLGTTNINVPIYTINTGKQQLPISLSYHSSGIKVNELASWIGLGWNLNSGGAIIRNTKGIADPILGNPNIPDLENYAFNEDNYDYFYRVFTSERDAAPDEFVINAPGLGGTFIFDQNNNNKAVFRDYNQVKVEVISNAKIKVIREDGTVLFFGTGADDSDATEVLHIPSGNIGSTSPIMTWYLTEMISPNGDDIISFKYKNSSSFNYPVATGESITIGNGFTNIKGDYPQLMRSDKKYLERIDFKNGYILFNSSSNREDLADEYKLDNIEVYFNPLVLNTSSSLVEEYTFNYDYFTRSGGSYPIGFFTNDRFKNSRKKSLKLNKVIIGKGGIGQEYSFDYNTTRLPLRGSKRQDYWGYANLNSGDLIIPTTITRSDRDNFITTTVGNGDRTGNETTVKAASLEKITYPTGGYTLFEYDTYKETETRTTNDIVIKSVTALAYGSGCNSNYGPSFMETTLADHGFTSTDYISGTGKIKIYFAPADDEGPNETKVMYNNQPYYSPHSTNGDPIPELEFTIDADLSPTDVLQAYEYRPGNFSAYGCPITCITASWEEFSGTTTTTVIDHFIGGLRIKSIKNYDGVQTEPISIKKFEYAPGNVLQPENMNSYVRKFLTEINGSLPVAKVSSNLSYNNNIGGMPVVEYGKVTEYDINTQTLTDNGKTVYFYKTIASQRLINSLPIIYKHTNATYPCLPIGSVRDVFGPLPELAMSQIRDISLFSFYNPVLWQHGSLEKKEVYKQTNDALNSYKIQTSTENTYTTLETTIIKNNAILPTLLNPDYDWNPYIGDCDGNDVPGVNNSFQFSYFETETSLGKKALTQTIGKLYDQNGENPVETITDLSYNDRYLLSESSTTNSHNETKISKTYYPDDILNSSILLGSNLSTNEKSAIDSLKTEFQHRISTPIQVETYLDIDNDSIADSNELLGLQRTNFKDWGQNGAGTNNIILPQNIQTLKGEYDATTNDLESRITYHDYDDKGNPIEVSKADGMHITYIWGYQQSQPIAKIEKATYSQVSGQVASLQNKSDLDIDATSEEVLRTALSNLRVSLPNAMVTTYTYDPLIGVTSITDPRGYTIYYEYDDFNRLKQVKDAEGHIVSKNEYHYKN